MMLNKFNNTIVVIGMLSGLVYVFLGDYVKVTYMMSVLSVTHLGEISSNLKKLTKTKGDVKQ